jgi:deazaflavin-dependent oxidoreductase (nitroreductase family)
MGAEELRTALEGTNDLDLTTVGRKSGRESSRPIWFVLEDDRVLLLPVSGSDSNWYRNVRETPSIELEAEGADYQATAETIEDQAEVDHVVDAFSAKYGAERVKEYYPKTDAAVEVRLA